MTASSLQRLATISNIRMTWRAFWRSSKGQRSGGVDGVTPQVFQRNVERHIERIRHELLNGYRFSLLRGWPVDKPNGKKRIICIPTVQDRIVQRLLAAHLTEKADRFGIINDASYGFVPTSGGKKRGVIAARDRAIALRKDHPWAYKSDISSFFDQIPRDQLIAQTVSKLRTPSLKSLIKGVVSCELDESDRYVARIAASNGIVRGCGVRQGMPLSPMFANIILRNFDREMMNQSIQLVRYADDFIVLADKEKECLKVDAIARKLLSPLGLELPPLGHTKTSISCPSEEIDFLGLALAPNSLGSYELLITEKQLAKVARSLNQLKDVDQLVHKRIDISNLVRTVENKIGGYLAAYRQANNVEELQIVLEHSRSEILRSVYVKAFGEKAVSSLSRNMRKVLCLG